MPILSPQVSPELGIKSLMSQFAIEDAPVSDEITNVPQALQYIFQKMKSSKNWKKVDKGTGHVAAVGLGVGAGALCLAVAPLAPIVTTLVGAAVVGEGVNIAADAAGVTKLNKINRGLKAAYKWTKGTKGKHRREAAKVLSYYAFRYSCTRSDDDKHGVIAYLALSKLYGGTEYIDNAMRSISHPDEFEPIVFKMLSSETADS
jgi:hypothetical protein